MRIRNLIVDCKDPYRLVGFWAQTTGLEEDPGNRNEPDDPEGLLVGAAGAPNLLFIKEDEPSGGGGRLRLDLDPTGRSRDEEVDRLLAMGATMVSDHRAADGEGWVVLADPEGNEFSVARRVMAEPATPFAPAAVIPAGAQPTSRAGAWLAGLRARGRQPNGERSASLARVAAEMRARLDQLARLALLLVEALIAVRVLLKVAGANEHAGFATFLYRVSSPLVAPFHPVFADRPVNGHPFEVGSLLAMAVYAAAAYLLTRLARAVVSPPP